jgi:hypothetical protein
MADFITDEPLPELNLMTFYIYNITNPQESIQRGYKPHILETGPYGYSKSTYKYDISFETTDSDLVSYKEYSMLHELTDPTVCTRMYFRMDRVLNVLLYNPCQNGKCDCISIDSHVRIVSNFVTVLLNINNTHPVNLS